MWWRTNTQPKRRRNPRRRAPTKHYQAHKELARSFVHERLAVHNAHYGFTYKRVAIKNQKTCWGSCSEHGNLNFNYKVYFLPPHLAEYVIIHELCHLAELNHSPRFWALVAERCPAYRECRRELGRVTVHGGRLVHIGAVPPGSPISERTSAYVANYPTQ